MAQDDPGEPTVAGLPRWLFIVVVVLAVSGVAAVLIGQCLTVRPHTDDEGYVLVSLRGVVSGHALYDEVYSQYGPAYFGVIGGLVTLLRIPLTMDAARVATALMWLLTAGVLGVSVGFVTRRKEAGLLAAVLTAIRSAAPFEAAFHPAHLVCLCAALAVLGVVVIERRGMSHVPAAMVGLAVAGALLSKINVGVFLAAAVFYALAAPRRRAFEVGRVLVVVGVPLALVALGSFGGQDSKLAWGLLVAAAIFVFGADHGTPTARFGLRLPVSYAIAAGVVVLLATIATGTSVNGLVRGVIVEPLGLADAFSIFIRVSSRTVAGLVVLAVVAVASRRIVSDAVSFAISALGALVMFLSAYTMPRTTEWNGLNLLVLGAAAAWVVTRASERGPSRLVIASLGVLFPLQAIPVAAGQRVAGALLFPAIAVIAAVDAIELAPKVLPLMRRQALRVAVPYALVAFAAVVGVRVLLETRTEWRATEQLDLRGARLVRTTPADARDLRAVTTALRRCATFYSLPGLNSFYVYADKRPPTRQNTTTWMALFDEQRQQDVVNALQRLHGFCVLRDDRVEAFWLVRGNEQAGPLRAYLETGLEPIAQYGEYEVYRHE